MRLPLISTAGMLTMTGARPQKDMGVYSMRYRDIGFGVFLLFLVSILPGCVMKEPLSNPDEAKLDDRLLGPWKFVDEKVKGHPPILHIGKADIRRAPPGIMKGVWLENDEKNQVQVSTYYFFPTCLGQAHYSNILDVNPLDGEKPKTWNENRVEDWLLTKYAVENDRLTIWLLAAKAAEEAVQKGEVKGIIEEKGLLKFKRTLLTDSKDLCHFLLNGGDKKLFSDEHKMVFSRIK